MPRGAQVAVEPSRGPKWIVEQCITDCCQLNGRPGKCFLASDRWKMPLCRLTPITVSWAHWEARSMCSSPMGHDGPLSSLQTFSPHSRTSLRFGGAKHSNYLCLVLPDAVTITRLSLGSLGIAARARHGTGEVRVFVHYTWSGPRF